SGAWSRTATEWPWASSWVARVAPTRPHPMMTKCTPRRYSVRGPVRWLAWTLVPSVVEAVKRVLVGRPVRSERLAAPALPKRLAFPAFSANALSSVAYAPDEILLTLAVAGMAGLVVAPWVGVAVVVVLLTVVASYRQTV